MLPDISLYKQTAELLIRGLKVMAVTTAQLCSASLVLNSEEQTEQRGCVVIVAVNKPVLLIQQPAVGLKN